VLRNVCTRFCPADAIGPEKQTVAGVTRWYVDTPACFPVFQQICLTVCPMNGRSIVKEGYKAIGRVVAQAKPKEGLLTYLAANTPKASENPILSQFLPGGAHEEDLLPVV
jgi:hypothetical protein